MVDQISPITVEAKAEFLRAKDRMIKALDTTPTDKLSWSPSETARTPIQIAAHVGHSIKGMKDWLAGVPFPFSSMKEMDAHYRDLENQITTKEKAIQLLDASSDEFVAFIEGLSEEQLASKVQMGEMQFPLAYAITFPADHIRGHVAQIHYIQTIYGDLSH